MCSVPRRPLTFHLTVATLDWRNLMGRLDLKPDSVSLRTLLEFTAAARRIGAEIEVDRWLIRPYVAGVEVTQGIQYFGAERHLTNWFGGPTNSRIRPGAATTGFGSGGRRHGPDLPV
jgi:hypothetical protein